MIGMKKMGCLLVFIFVVNTLFGQQNKLLMAQLDSIYMDDQLNRLMVDSVDATYGWESEQMHLLLDTIREKDSINLIKVTAILDKYGWLGIDSIGRRGNATLFLVIQHSNLPMQDKYLPMMRDAVKKGYAQGEDLALLEDNVALGHDTLQMYGTQIRRDNETHQFYVAPLFDPENVDKRRASVGLEPLADYLKFWQIKWDVEQYKKDLPKYIAFEKRIIK